MHVLMDDIMQMSVCSQLLSTHKGVAERESQVCIINEQLLKIKGRRGPAMPENVNISGGVAHNI